MTRVCFALLDEVVVVARRVNRHVQRGGPLAHPGHRLVGMFNLALVARSECLHADRGSRSTWLWLAEAVVVYDGGATVTPHTLAHRSPLAAHRSPLTDRGVVGCCEKCSSRAAAPHTLAHRSPLAAHRARRSPLTALTAHRSWTRARGMLRAVSVFEQGRQPS